MTSDQLEEQPTALMARSDAKPSQVILAMLGAAAAKIAQIECPNCRTVAAGRAIAAFPSIMSDALKFAAKTSDGDDYDDDDSGPLPGHDHRH